MEQSKKTSFVQGATILGIAGLFVKVIGAVYRIPLARIVDDGMRYYEVAYPYYTWLLVISSAGIPTAISKMVSERVASGDISGAKRVFSSALKLLTVIGIVTSILLFAFSGSIARLCEAEPAKLSFMALAPALFFVSIMCAYRGYLQGMQCMTGTAISQVIEQVIKLLVGFTLAYILIAKYPERPELAAMGALIGVSVSELVALIVIKLYYDARMRRGTLPVCARGTTLAQSVESTASITKKLLAIAIPITIGASIMPVTGIADSALIINILKAKNIAGGMLADEAEYVAGTSFQVLRSYVTPLINMPAVLTLALSMSLVPAISQAVARRDRRTAHKATDTGMKLALFIGAPCAVGLFILGGPIMAMLYPKVAGNPDIYREAQSIMYFAAIGVLFLSLVQTLTGVIQGMGKPQIPVFFLAIGGAVKVISMILLMKFTDMGILGAALSTVLCYAIAAIGDIFFVLHYTRMRISYVDTFIKPLLASALMGVVVFFVFKLLSGMGRPTVGTILAIGAGVLVYFGCLILLRPFTADDLEFLPKANLFAKIFRVRGKRSV
ncbi:MAG: polysaccharide biosynthesis protein [Clostridia bacterium]|nr:polysaccharide biosynthesis protein [Clostridia bacterium]